MLVYLEFVLIFKWLFNHNVLFSWTYDMYSRHDTVNYKLKKYTVVYDLFYFDFKILNDLT